MSARYYPERRLMLKGVHQCVPPCLGMCRRVTNKGEGGFGKGSDRAKTKDHRPQGIPVVVVGRPLSGRGKAWLMEGHYRVPTLSHKRSNQALSPPSSTKGPRRISTKCKHELRCKDKRGLVAFLSVSTPALHPMTEARPPTAAFPAAKAARTSGASSSS